MKSSDPRSRELSRAPEEDANVLDDADGDYDNLQANLGAG